MNIDEKIYYTWIALLLPIALSPIIIDKDEHPIAPIAILFVLTIVTAIYEIWK